MYGSMYRLTGTYTCVRVKICANQQKPQFEKHFSSLNLKSSDKINRDTSQNLNLPRLSIILQQNSITETTKNENDNI